MPGALRVRIAPSHPGLSPAAVVGRVRQNGLRRLLHTAFGPGGELGEGGSAG
jgi:hypothetical protein